MKVLQTIKFFFPSTGGMETVAKNILDGIFNIDKNILFTVYANSHLPSKLKDTTNGNLRSITASTPIIFKSQPATLIYPKLNQLIKETDIIHHHYPFPNMEIALLRNIGLVRQKKLIVTWHANIDNSRWSWISVFYNPIIAQILKCASTIVVTSPQLFENSKILKKFKEKVVVIPLSFSSEFSSAKGNRMFPVNRPFNLLFVGKLREYKGLLFLLEAIKDLNVKLSIVGDGEQLMVLNKLVDDLDIRNKVVFKSGLDDLEVINEYEEADLFILPSINEAEAFGVVQLEAMASGLPVINTYLNSGVPFVSLHEVTGLTVKPKDATDLRDAIKRIINSPEFYEELSKNAVERSKEFTTEKMSNSYLNLYKI